MTAVSSDVVFGVSLEALVLPSQLPSPELRIDRPGSMVRLTWDAPGWTLEWAPAPEGSWTTFAQQASPAEFSPGGRAAFFRLRL